MKFKELKALPAAELREKSLELYKELIKDNAQVAIGTVPKNPRKLRLAKKTIAKIAMILATPKTAPAAQPAKAQPKAAPTAKPKSEALKQ
jgi:ribosomal protein L29